ncbi:hypothetical protein MUN81_02550 [Hymenobacter sp. 5317J-9]|uniref:hypothetical protein n=1 Tax=Hymenobacter sp. 5317J-9 TaxID=2932250 RepID=UPI001FD65461|nr:hypothetical protein [Hymenobacter sp. 5317J-9]UOQ98374.1 hypothetical protein MUN81_02550 [Hymenobacter sp. 5317J-9]
MSANPIDDTTTPKTTGSLEELFRHHLGEEAAVPPRPMLWDQIDNSLLIRQNEVYRKRLVATRWVAAASLLLATLAGTGWWAQHDGSFGGTEVATTTNTAGTGQGQRGTYASAPAAARPADNAGQLNGATLSQNSANSSTASASATNAPEAAGTYASSGNTGLRERNTIAARTYATNSAPAGTGFGSASVRQGFGKPSAAQEAGAVAASRGAVIAQADQVPASVLDGGAGALRTAESGLVAAGAVPASGVVAAAIPVGGASAATEAAGVASAPAALSQTAAVAGPQQMGLLAARPATLSLTDVAGLPKGLATVTLPEPTPAAEFGKWHYGVSYAASVYNPNVNFSRQGIESEFDYNPALGPDSPALTEAAATQYRENLRPGLSQRIALLATRHLKGHWSASTGLEFVQATAKSATSSSFVGEQLYDLGSFTNGDMRTTNFRYRTAGVPFQVSYSNPVKRGWSIYGRLGGVVSALLGARSEVEGEPEATKTYSVLTAGGPYRRVLGSVRGAAGAQFRPVVGNWALTLGPVAEMGLVPLNAHPAQSYLAQSRPYSFGMEAGVEFGR